MNDHVVDVAAAVIQRADGSFLLTRRPEGKAYAGYWEFPGGKIEAGERPHQALARELLEELGLQVRRCYPWLTRTYTYPHATVRLHFMRVNRWEGEPYGREGQALAWQTPGRITESPVLPANTPILKALQLPPLYAITCAEELGIMQALRGLDASLAAGLKLVQLRDKNMDRTMRMEFGQQVAARCAAAGARLLVNDDPDLAAAIAADGVHYSSGMLRSLSTRPGVGWCAASCHNSEELMTAARLGLDFVVLGPVKPTPSHPEGRPMGWSLFGELLRDYPLPVYALGGLDTEDLDTATACGAHGIAQMRAAWRH